MKKEPGVKNEDSAPIFTSSQSRRIWLPKFSVFSLLLSVTAVAVLLAGFLGSRKIQALQKLADRNEELEARQQVIDRSIELLNSIDPGDSEKHDAILMLIKRIRPLPDRSEPPEICQLLELFATQGKLTAIDNEAEGLELLQLNYNSSMQPGLVSTALALFRHDTCIDSVLRSASSRIEGSHTVRTTDVNGDGRLDVIIEVEPGIWKRESKSVVFEISGDGFTLLSND